MVGFNTQPPEGGWKKISLGDKDVDVSTHSRPRAAGPTFAFSANACKGFNTQPPEGGWTRKCTEHGEYLAFQHTAARGRLEERTVVLILGLPFQHTAARGRLVNGDGKNQAVIDVSTHSRPRAAGLSGWGTAAYLAYVSTHSRPRAAGIQLGKEPLRDSVSTHSRPRAAGSFVLISINRNKFQHTAARGRLDLNHRISRWDIRVSTHSRPRAAGSSRLKTFQRCHVSTHSRPRAAGLLVLFLTVVHGVSTHSRPRAAGPEPSSFPKEYILFQHTAARGRLAFSL